MGFRAVYVGQTRAPPFFAREPEYAILIHVTFKKTNNSVSNEDSEFSPTVFHLGIAEDEEYFVEELANTGSIPIAIRESLRIIRAWPKIGR